MKKTIVFLCGFALSLCGFAQKDETAKTILDKVSAMVAGAGGIEADFEVTTSRPGMYIREKGKIRVKGDKFLLEAGGVTTWFDGKTQWSYFEENDEVNISEPTAAELRSINPYLLLDSYKKGYNYKYEGRETMQGVATDKVVLTSGSAKEELVKLTLFIAPATSRPLRIVAEMRDKTVSEITLLDFRDRRNFEDGLFRFNRSSFPDAEIIDLR